MPSVQTLVFTRSGALLAELEPALESVSWRVNGIGMSRFPLSMTDAKCTKDNLRPGNLVLHRFDNGLPDWGGVIDPPRGRQGTQVTATAYTAEKKFTWRRSGKNKRFAEVVPGTIFETLIQETNAESASGVVIGSIFRGGTVRTLEYHYHQLFKRFTDLATLTGHDFMIKPVYAGGALTFEASWYESLGSDKSANIKLIEDRNIEPPSLSEQGPIYNKTLLVGEGASWGTERIESVAQDSGSQNEYGYRVFSEVQGGVVKQETLDGNADEMLTLLSEPRMRLSVSALDKEPGKFSAYDIGDTVWVEAFLRFSEWAYSGPARVMAREWLPNNVCRLEMLV